MLKTSTGGFAIGFRRGWSDWQKDLPGLTKWALENGFGVVDLGSDADEAMKVPFDAGMCIGSADLKGWSGLISDDKAKRKDSIDQNRDYIAKCAAAGIHNFFAVMLPADASKKRSENFALMVEGLSELATVLEANKSFLVIEGWPGPGALACTPEGYRALFREVPSKSMAVNFDPSHLIRMGIDAVRFVEEFADRVKHVHGKDTEIMSEALYEFGTEQPATFDGGHGFGSHFWRYTIPGHGCFRWKKAFEILANAGYNGAVSIELEDENFNGSEEGEKKGLIAGGQFLASC